MEIDPRANKERIFILFILVLNFFFVAEDLFDDLKATNVPFLHVLTEFLPLILTGVGVVFVLVRWQQLRHKASSAERDASKARELAKAHSRETQVWRQKTSSLAEGIARAIDRQLDTWKLSNAEKEISLLLLKGLSLKEIADLRKTTDRTVRQQAASVYQKSGLTGRSELSAFFLEDILVQPQIV